MSEKKVELSLRLSHIDPAAAKELRKAQGKNRGKKARPTSDGESAESR